MDETSTQIQTKHQATASHPSPKVSTLELIRQFARTYMPLGSMPGLVLN